MNADGRRWKNQEGQARRPKGAALTDPGLFLFCLIIGNKNPR
jgi:hypothetical protein